jgi:hypothetical protein
MQPQVQALAGNEATRIGLGVERFELRDGQPGLLRDLKVSPGRTIQYGGSLRTVACGALAALECEPERPGALTTTAMTAATRIASAAGAR